MKSYRNYLTIILFAFLFSCASQQVSTLIGYDYDEKKDQTDYFVFPYGNVSIPGKWEKTNYNSTSRQQFFINVDSISIAVAFGPCTKFEFNADRSKVGFEFVKTYYEWDSQFFVNSYGLSRELIKQDSSKNYIIWRLYGLIDKGKIDNYFLFGENNCNVSNFSILDTDEWSKEQKIEFLEKLYVSEEK